MKGLILTKLLANSSQGDFDKSFETAEKGFNLVFNMAITISIIIGLVALIVAVTVIIKVIKNRKKIGDATTKVGKAITNKLEGLFEEKKEEGIAVCSQCGAKVETINGKGTCQYCGGKVINK